MTARRARRVRTWKQIRASVARLVGGVEEVQGTHGAIEWVMDLLASEILESERVKDEHVRWLTREGRS